MSVDAKGIAPLLSLDGKVALVTGAAGAIGSATAALLRAAGARVAAVDLPGLGVPLDCEAMPSDLSAAGAAQDLLARFAASFDRLDVIVHAAGITRDAVLWKLSDEAWADVMGVNLDAAFRLLREATPWLRRQGGAVVLISSINGERGKFGQANYAASKAGLIALGKTAAKELGRFGVRVNVIAPGLIETPMTAGLPGEALAKAREETALGHFGKPEDVARAALYLAAPLSSHVTGQVLRVDGGQLTA